MGEKPSKEQTSGSVTKKGKGGDSTELEKGRGILSLSRKE